MPQGPMPAREAESTTYEENASGILNQAPEIHTGYHALACEFQNKTGSWIELKELSLPIGVDTRSAGDWYFFGNLLCGAEPGPPESADRTGTFTAGGDPNEYTIISLLGEEIRIAPGECFAIGIQVRYVEYDLLVGAVPAVPGALSWEWDGNSWTPLEADENRTALIQVGGDFMDTSDLLVLPDGSGTFATIQQAIDAVTPGGTVRLANGLFKGPGNYRLEFGGKNLTLRSVSENPEICIIECPTIPDGRLIAGGILFTSNEGPAAIVDGITIRGGVQEFGAGILIVDSSPTIRNCILEDGYSALGAGIYVSKGSPEIIGCLFRGNYAEWAGGGLFFEVSDGLVSYCRFEHNLAGNYGGGALFGECDGATLEHSIFYQNTSDGFGGGIALGETAMMISNCTLSENLAPKGSGIYLEGIGPDIWMTIISFGNSEALWSDVPRSVPEFVCCDIFGNTGGDWDGPISDQLGTDGNFSLDPEYCGELGTGDLTLQDDSPCAPGGNDCGLLIGGDTVECDDTVTASTTWSSLKQLY